MLKMKWVTGAVMLACSGALMACEGGTTPGAAGTSSAAATVTATPSATTGGTAPGTATVAPPSGKAPAAPPAPAGAPSAELSGKREVTIVRAQASEGGVSLDDRLIEADDNSGRQLFVPTPIGGDKYLIKAYTRANNHPAADEASCWQAYNPGNGGSLTVEGALCDAKNPAQQFTIIPNGKGSYGISNNSAYLQHSPTNGLILEELGDAPLRSTFRFVDNGPARRPAGG
ncbi:hypothetical protein [Micromonospora sp. NBC_01796]|uniref:hypothetical protein n=1 Tax=Micromonospora sp. NBC_01796 TaxID=2975987 RepID=UPI002DDC0793|nr:hypothetical protein [Micromonospora sp. NBC_01796]WSA88737.1 hypothetical protein OIE47_14660 [Micromonospora sp. NBC_01796]